MNVGSIVFPLACICLAATAKAQDFCERQDGIFIETESFDDKGGWFVDCTGDGTVGYLAGADFLMGREGRDEFGEAIAPKSPDKLTMGASAQWYSQYEGKPFRFPEFSYGLDFNEESSHKVMMGEWTWENGMSYDQIADFERISRLRDAGCLFKLEFLEEPS